jgi:hypothetical protein
VVFPSFASARILAAAPGHQLLINGGGIERGTPRGAEFPVRILVSLDVQRGKKRMEGSGQAGLSVFYWWD